MLPLASRRLGRGLVLAGLLVYAFVLLRTAWLCDDAYITFRTVDNLFHGIGPRWNAAERVQAYTHPLWLLLLSSIRALTGEMYFAPFLLSIGVSLAVLAVLAFALARTPGAALMAVCISVGSKAFVDFSTSGLENPLAHLLLLLFYLALVREWQAWCVGLLASGLLLTRTDLAVLILPGLLLWFFSPGSESTRLKLFSLGLVPLVLWHGFALIYYGSLFPNTAHAKLDTGIARMDLVRQGLTYLRESLRSDPLTVPVILAGCLGSLLQDGRRRAFAGGVLLYLAYVVSIGGDFMSGRFLTVGLLVATTLLVETVERFPQVWHWAAAVAVSGLGLLAPYPNLLSDADYGLDRGNDFANLDRAARRIIGRDGISDERAWHYRLTGLWRVRVEDGRLVLPMTGHVKYQELMQVRASGKKVVTFGAIGFRGFYLGPDVHVIDPNALADPLLSRLPTVDPRRWRVSHFVRPIPCGYPESLEGDRNVLRDPHLARVYDAVRLVTRGPLLRWDRLREIVRLNTGYYADSLAAYENDAGCP